MNLGEDTRTLAHASGGRLQIGKSHATRWERAFGSFLYFLGNAYNTGYSRLLDISSQLGVVKIRIFWVPYGDSVYRWVV